jgi:hypothetical protein
MGPPFIREMSVEIVLTEAEFANSSAEKLSVNCQERR